MQKLSRFSFFTACSPPVPPSPRLFVMSSPSLPGLPSPGDAVVDVVDVAAFDISFTLGLIGVTGGDGFEVGVAGVALEEDANPPPKPWFRPWALIHLLSPGNPAFCGPLSRNSNTLHFCR